MLLRNNNFAKFYGTVIFNFQADLVATLKDALGDDAQIIDWRKNTGSEENSKTYIDVQGLRVSFI